MKLTDVNQYVALRASLTKEKVKLEARLAAINRALGTPSSAPVGVVARIKNGPKPGSRRKRAKNVMSMKEAAVKVLTGESLDRHDVLKAVISLGYKFSAKNPLNSISSMLYADKAFKNAKGKFTLAK